jgi:uncharacterized phage infection (PIP) family protein YhgE
VARANSVINVSIIGDAKKLIGAVGDADKATGGLIKSAAKVGIAAGVIDKVFEVIGDSLGKADDFNDAFAVLARTIGKTDAQKIKDMAFDFSNIGLSADEVGTLATQFANLAQSSGIAAPTISALTPDILDIAAAIHAQSPDKTLDEIVSDIGKAAAGSQKPVRDLGVVIDKSLNPDEQLRSILDQLKKKYGDANTAAGDFAGAQDTVTAKFDNFKIKLGEVLDGPLKGVLDVFNNILDDIPQLDKDLRNLGGAFETLGRTALAPLGNIRDALEGILNLLGQVSSGANTGQSSGLRGRQPGARMTDREINAAYVRERERNGLGV